VSADSDIDQGPVDPHGCECIIDGRTSDDGEDVNTDHYLHMYLDSVDVMDTEYYSYEVDTDHYDEWYLETNTPPQKTYELTDWLETAGVDYKITHTTVNRCYLNMWDLEARSQFEVDFGEHQHLVLVSGRDLLKGVTTAILTSRHWQGHMLVASAMQQWHQSVHHNKAVRLIQAAWRESVANPAYQVCQRRLLEEFSELAPH
jgi:hypothetical protein